MAKRSIVSQGVEFVRHVLPSILKPLRTLWHEVIGFVFLALAVMAVPQGWRTLRDFDGEPEGFFKVVLIGAFVAIMGYYAITSFRRARRISRS